MQADAIGPQARMSHRPQVNMLPTDHAELRPDPIGLVAGDYRNLPSEPSACDSSAGRPHQGTIRPSASGPDQVSGAVPAAAGRVLGLDDLAVVGEVVVLLGPGFTFGTQGPQAPS